MDAHFLPRWQTVGPLSAFWVVRDFAMHAVWLQVSPLTRQKYVIVQASTTTPKKPPRKKTDCSATNCLGYGGPENATKALPDPDSSGIVPGIRRHVVLPVTQQSCVLHLYSMEHNSCMAKDGTTVQRTKIAARNKPPTIPNLSNRGVLQDPDLDATQQACQGERECRFSQPDAPSRRLKSGLTHNSEPPEVGIHLKER